MGRSIASGALVFAQMDIYVLGGGTRLAGTPAAQITASMFVNNGLLPWTLEDGGPVPDSSISAGKVYFNEISGSPGFYSVRFFPDRVGFWRLVLRYAVLGAETILEFDVVPAASNPPNGLNASFIGG